MTRPTLRRNRGVPTIEGTHAGTDDVRARPGRAAGHAYRTCRHPDGSVKGPAYAARNAIKA